MLFIYKLFIFKKKIKSQDNKIFLLEACIYIYINFSFLQFLIT